MWIQSRKKMNTFGLTCRCISKKCATLKKQDRLFQSQSLLRLAQVSRLGPDMANIPKQRTKILLHAVIRLKILWQHYLRKQLTFLSFEQNELEKKTSQKLLSLDFLRYITWQMALLCRVFASFRVAFWLGYGPWPNISEN